MKLLTAEVQVSCVPSQFNSRTEEAALAIKSTESLNTPRVIHSSEECWHLLASRDCQMIDDLDIERMLTLIDRELAVLLEAAADEMDNDKEADFNDAIQDLEGDQGELRKEATRRDALDILADRKRIPHHTERIQGMRALRSERISRNPSKPEAVSHSSVEGVFGGSKSPQQVTIVDVRTKPALQKTSKVKRTPIRKHAVKRPGKKRTRLRIVIEY